MNIIYEIYSYLSNPELEAVSLIANQGYSVLQAARTLGVGETALRHWVQQLTEEPGGSASKEKALTAEQQNKSKCIIHHNKKCFQALSSFFSLAYACTLNTDSHNLSTAPPILP